MRSLIPSVLLTAAVPVALFAAPKPAPKAPAGQKSWVVAGKALLPGGKPAVGAHVWVGWDANVVQGGFAEGTAGAGGDFKVMLRADRLERVVIGGVAPGTAPSWRVVKLPQRGVMPPVAITLGAPVTLAGRLIRTTGAGAPGVRLDVSELRPTTEVGIAHLLPPGVVQKLGARTDKEGRFRLTGLPPRCDAALTIGDELMPADGSSPQFRLGTPGAQEGGMLAVTRSGSIQAALTTPGGQPALGPALRVRRAAPALSGSPVDRLFAGYRAQVSAQTAPVEIEPNGLARIDNLPPGRYELAVRGKSHPVDVPENGVAGPLKIVTRAELFTGSVTDPEGKPVRARVETWVGRVRAGWPPSSDQPVTTKENGAFEMIDFPWSAPLATVRAVSGNDLAEWTGNPADLHGPLALRLQKDALVTVRGRLRSSDGKPLAGVNVAVFSREATGPRAWAIGQTDAEGAFSVTGVPRGKRVAAGVAVAGAPLESAFRETPDTGEKLDLGDVKLQPSPTGLSDPDDMAAALSPATVPSAGELSAARDAAWRYLQAVRAGDLKQVQALTDPATPGYSAELGSFLRSQSLRLPAAAGTLTREALQPLAVVPRLTYLYLFGAGEERENLMQAAALFDQPDWASVGYRNGAGVSLLAVLHRGAGGWKVLGGLQDDMNSAASVSGDPKLFGAPYPAPSAEPVLAAARAYLEAWSRGDHAALWKLTSPHAPEYDPKADSFLKKWSARADRGQAPSGVDVARPELDSRFTRWDVALLLAYPRMLAQVRAGQSPSLPAVSGFPHADVLAGDAAVVRYRAGETGYVMLLHRRAGRWEVVEPALRL